MNADTVRELLSNATPGEWAILDIPPQWTLLAKRPASEPTEGPWGRELMPHLMPHNVMRISRSERPKPGDAALIAAAPAVAQWGLERDAEVARLREALNRVNQLQVGWWEEVIALSDPDADTTPAQAERAEVLKRINHQLNAVAQGIQ